MLNAAKFSLCSLSLALLHASAIGAGLQSNAADARGLGMGGATNVTDSSPLPGAISNPASTAWLEKSALSLSGRLGIVRGRFTDRDGNSSSLRDEGFAPDGALALRLNDKFTLNLGATTDASTRADWRYRDVPGGADGGTSYGVRGHYSELVTSRLTAGLAWQPTETLSFGANVSAVYNRNRLAAPFIFQNQATLRTVKTLLNLETEGWGTLFQFGAQWRPSDKVTVGLAYRAESRVETHGTARGNADVQLQRLGLGGARPDFEYDAQVDNTFPQTATIGLEWKATDRLTVATSLEWVDWSRTFDTLVVNLRDGNNADLNGLTGGENIHDEIPLKWRDQWIVRLGMEYALTDSWLVRAGYAWSRSPVPDETLTPLTALLPEHTVSAGVGWKKGDWRWDLGWEWQIPRSVSVGDNILAAGEYQNATTKVGLHWIGLTGTWQF